jgi:hypothetical protein
LRVAEKKSAERNIKFKGDEVTERRGKLYNYKELHNL